MRKDAREAVYKALFSGYFNQEGEKELLNSILLEAKLNEKDSDFALKLFYTIKENREELDGIIARLALNYKLERVYLTDRCALLIGLAEMTYFTDVPAICAIDEALSLCRKFSTEKSLGFVNGIFAKYKSETETEAKAD